MFLAERHRSRSFRVIQKIGVLVSGTGSLLDAMIQDGLPISLVVADRPCRGLEIAYRAHIPIRLVDRRRYGYTNGGLDFDRSGFTEQITRELLEHGVNLVAMAGFMTIFSPSIFRHFKRRILNSHPSLLPAFKGEKAVADALAAGVAETGTTIHIATEQLDEGPILAQERVAILEGDTVATLHERIKQVERPLYPRTIRDFSTKF